MKIKIKDLDTFATDLEKTYEVLALAQELSADQENPFYKELLEGVIEKNVEITPDELEIPQSKKTIGWIVWYNNGSRPSMELDGIYPTKKDAEFAIEQSIRDSPRPGGSANYTTKEVFI